VNGNPSAARNTDDATQESVDIQYTQQLLSLQSNTYEVNAGGSATITIYSRGKNGNVFYGYDTNSDVTDKAFVGSDVAVSVDSRYKTQQKSKVVTISAFGTKHIKAFHSGDSDATVGGTAIIVAPTFTYDVPADISIPVSTTRTLDISNPVGNNTSVVITSSPNKGGGTNSATLTPLLANDVYTISYVGSADYGQDGAAFNKSRTVTVNPTVSVSLSADQGNYPITDENNQTITSAKHGISPTIFTADPTVAGDTQTTFAWTLTGLPLETGYTTSTADDVKFKMTDNGSVLRDLTVSGNSTSGIGAFTVVTQAITKAFDNQPVIATTATKLRRHSSYAINFTCDYIKNVKLQRRNPANSDWGALIGSTATPYLKFTID
jgi:hypothetical protein